MIKHLFRPYFILFFAIVFFSSLKEIEASHLRAGEIIATRRSTFEYDFTLILYKNTQGAIQPLATLNFSDGTNATIHWSDSLPMPDNTARLTYNFTKKRFTGAAKYTISFTENYRNDAILNINSGTSNETPFYVETEIFINVFLGSNNSTQFLAPPIDKGNIGQIFTHSPGAWDPDGDSLVFELIVPKSQKGVEVPNYVSPTEINGNGKTTFTINPQTGLITWNTPLKGGLYNVAFKVTEWKRLNGEADTVGSITRDMQIYIDYALSSPKIFIPNDSCITAGTILNATIKATNKGFNNESASLELEKYSGIFDDFLKYKVTTSLQPVNLPGGDKEINMTFKWSTTCDMVRDQPYQLTFKAYDPRFILADIKVWQIKIIPPELKNLKATPNGRKIKLTWNADEYNSACTNVDSVAILRKDCSNDTTMSIDSCSTGREIPQGYKLIKKVPKSINEFTDDNFGNLLDYESQYCYYIYAQFPAPKQGFSRASAVACTSLLNNVPLIIGASVLQTDSINGKVEVKWVKPRHIDAIATPPPYRVIVKRYESNILAATFAGSNLGDTTVLADTVFNDSPVDTKKNNLKYQIEFYSGNAPAPLFTSDTAHTVKLLGIARNKKINLLWESKTPWIVDTTYIFRVTDGDTLLIDTVSQSGYIDQPVETGKKYTYFVQTKGSFGCNKSLGLNKVPASLKNYSQRITLIPVEEIFDTLKPCPPTLYINKGGCENETAIVNTLNWLPTYDFLCDSNIAGYRLYLQNANGELTQYLNEMTSDTFFHGTQNKPVAGCFAVTAINAKNLESAKSNVVCSDTCDSYILPNVFTPNGDGINDLFQPKPFPRNIDIVVFTVYNRWGTEVFKSENDININWTGENMPDGMYYYKASATVRNGSGTFIRQMNGWIVITR